MAEKEQKYWQKTNTQNIEGSFRERRRGQTLGFFMGTSCLMAAVTLGVIGATVTASIVGGSTIVGLVTVFVIGRKLEKRKKN